jgi:hypothetical protein
MPKACNTMLGTRRTLRPAGGSAGRRFRELARAWRRRALRPVWVACSLLFLALSVAGTVASGQAKFWLGMLAGATIAFYVGARETPPWHIEKWRFGEEGERRTAKALRRLQGTEWSIWHDLAAPKGTNIDHVLVGPAGVFLLDSKNYSGEARTDDGELKVRWLEDPEEGWVCRGLVPRMRAARAELKEAIEAATGVRVWVQPVVVLWMSFPERVAQMSDVFVVQGSALSEWLRTRTTAVRPFDAARVEEFLASHHSPGK